jgi:hypothetical protein
MVRCVEFHRSRVAAPLLIAALLLLLSVALPIDAAASGTVQRPSEVELSQIPDLTNPSQAKELKCSSCRSVAREVFDSISSVSKLRHGHPKHYELVDAVDKLCVDIGRSYGLLLKNNKPTTEFSKNAQITRYQGAWINTYLERRCGEILEHYDDDLLREALRHDRVDRFREVLCTSWEKSCHTKEDAIREDL